MAVRSPAADSQWDVCCLPNQPLLLSARPHGSLGINPLHLVGLANRQTTRGVPKPTKAEARSHAAQRAIDALGYRVSHVSSCPQCLVSCMLGRVGCRDVCCKAVWTALDRACSSQDGQSLEPVGPQSQGAFVPTTRRARGSGAARVAAPEPSNRVLKQLIREVRAHQSPNPNPNPSGAHAPRG